MERGDLRFPWEFYQQACLGALRWSPDQFWGSTIWEADRAIEGYRYAKGIKRPEDEPLTDDEIEELKRMHPDPAGNGNP